MHDGLSGAPLIGHKQIEPLNSGKIALLDADYLKYITTHRVFKASEGKQQFPDPEKFLRDQLDSWFAAIEDPIIFCFSGQSSNTFRYSVGFEKEYKGNRKGKVDAYDYDRKLQDMMFVLEYIQENYVTIMFPDLEADDIVSALQDERTYIISKDKDLRQVPGWHYDIGTMKLIHIDPIQATRNLCHQLITGDGTDNIPGVPGMGVKSADKVIAEIAPKDLYYHVMGLYMKKYGSRSKGVDAFCENFLLVKVRENRGEWFKAKYQDMFSIKEQVYQNLKERAGL